MQKQMTDIVRYSEEMLMQAKQGDWASVEQTQAKRAHLIDAQTQPPISKAQSLAVAQLIHTTQTLDREIEQLAREKQQEILEVRQQLSQSSKAINAYKKT